VLPDSHLSAELRVHLLQIVTCRVLAHARLHCMLLISARAVDHASRPQLPSRIKRLPRPAASSKNCRGSLAAGFAAHRPVAALSLAA
jgi:hypothetical protein